jgi:hypothetical protein
MLLPEAALVVDFCTPFYTGCCAEFTKRILCIAAINFMLSNGYTDVLLIVCDVIAPLAVDVLPYLNTVNEDSEISAVVVPLRLALAEEFYDELSRLFEGTEI